MKLKRLYLKKQNKQWHQETISNQACCHDLHSCQAELFQTLQNQQAFFLMAKFWKTASSTCCNQSQQQGPGWQCQSISVWKKFIKTCWLFAKKGADFTYSWITLDESASKMQSSDRFEVGWVSCHGVYDEDNMGIRLLSRCLEKTKLAMD